MLRVEAGNVWIESGRMAARLQVRRQTERGWEPLAFTGTGGELRAEAPGLRVLLLLVAEPDSVRYELDLQSDTATRLQVALAVPGCEEPFHLIPGLVFGDNNLHGAEPGHFPNLTCEHPQSPSCAPYWEFRADRASHPVSLLVCEKGVAGVSVNPYSDCDPEHTSSREGFVRNGVFAQLAHGGGGHECGVTLGYRNTPRTFRNKDLWVEPTEHAVRRARAWGRLFARAGGGRRAAHGLVRRVYEDHRETPLAPLSGREAADALVDAFLRVSWHDETGHNLLGTYSGECSAFHGGGLMAEHFTNMSCRDPAKKLLTAWRMLPEIGWTGGAAVAWPLLAAGRGLGHPVAVDRALYLLDWVGRAHNPASGLLWDVCGKNQKSRADGWWSGYLVQGAHAAYTNGNGLYYLLKSALFLRERMGTERPRWIETATAALDTVLRLQREDGHFGFSYRTDRAEVLDWGGFAGAWFIPALALAHRATRFDGYLRAARRGLACYGEHVRRLTCCGTPLDTWKSPDQEGVLGFIRGARLLHELTGDDEALALLADAAEYEYLWRYGFRARPECPPLAQSHFNSCGGSLTSVSNPHIHPMGINICAELDYLARESGDPYHAARLEDGRNWGLNAVSLYPEVTGYGIRGVLTERFCPSDGLLIETWPDGSPSSLWFSYNGWAAASVLEGLIETLPEAERASAGGGGKAGT